MPRYFAPVFHVFRQLRGNAAGRTRLNEADRERHRRETCCFYCGQPDHLSQQCSLGAQKQPTSCRNLCPRSSPVSQFQSPRMIDSGAAGTFIDQNIVKQLNIPTQLLPRHQKIQTIDGGHFGECIRTQPMCLNVSVLHQEYITLLITVSPGHPIILGLLWMEQHNPSISWSDKEITKWS